MCLEEKTPPEAKFRLLKLPEIDVPIEEPFRNDRLDREHVVNRLTSFIETLDQPFVLSVEAGWGRGKTTFLKMWKAVLTKKKHPCIYINAWEIDFAGDPLTAMLFEVQKGLELYISDEKSPLLQRFRDSASCLAVSAVKRVIESGTQGLITVEDFAGATKVMKGQPALHPQKAAYESVRKQLDDFRDHLAAVVLQLTQEASHKSPFVIFVDELDRCRPDFAITFLERIKHIFSVPGICFILAVDRTQLCSMVQRRYGNSMAPEGYLRRFIDLSFALPHPSLATFCDVTAKRFGLTASLPDRADFSDISKYFAALANIFNLSLREVEQCFTELNVIRRISRSRIDSKLLAYLVALRAGDPTLFERFASDDVTPEVFLERISRTKFGRQFLQSKWGQRLHAHLLAGLLSEDQLENYTDQLKKHRKDDDPNISDPAGNLLRQVQEVVHQFDLHEDEELQSILDTHLELVFLTVQFD